MQLSYYVYGDFQSVVNAFRMVANLFSNNTYQSWFTVVILLTIAAFAFQTTAERIFGAKVSDAIWIKRVMIGTVLYSIFMVPTVTLHVYDPIKNKYEAVGGVPAGVGLIAGITSGFTREISELIETAGNPILDFDDIGFGHGYEMLAAVSSLGSIGVSQDQNLSRTIADYFDKCIIQMQATGDLDMDALWNGNGKSILENISTDYRIFSSTVWSASNPGGVLYHCADSYQHIVTQLNQPTRINNAFRVFCSKVGYNPTDTTEFLMCRQKFRGVYEAFGTPEGFGYNEANLFASSVIAQMYLTDGVNSGVERAKEIARSMANASDAVSGAMAADFMPMIQGMVATILISLFVIVALLMYVAPMDAFKFYFGLWIWFLTWVLVDVVINIQVQNYAYNVFREIRETGLSLTTMFTIGDSSAQILGWYGKARWMSMTIASMMTYGIFKFGGGAAFASFAGALGASYSGQAASQGAQIGAPGGEAAQYKKTADDLAGVKAVTVGAGVNPRQYLQAVENTRMSDIGSQVRYGEDIGAEASKNFGGSSYEVGSMIGGAKAYNDIKSGHTASMLQEQGYDAERVAAGGAFNTAGQTGAAEKTRAVEQAEGLDYAQTLAEGGVGRNLRFFSDANFRQQEAERTGNSLMDTYQSEANFRKAVNENGYENIAVDLNGNVVAREGFYSKMRVDTDQNGVGMEMTNVKYNTATGDLEGMYNGKVYKMQGEFLDGDGKDGMISIKPVDTEWRATYQKLNVDGQELTGVQAKGFGLHSESSMKIEGNAMIDGEMKKVTAFGQGDIKQGEHGAYTTGSFSILDADSSKMNTHKEGTDNQIIDRDTETVDKGLRQRTGDQVKDGDDIEAIDRNVTTVVQGLRSKVGDESRIVDINSETYDRNLNYSGTFTASLQKDKAVEVAAQPVSRAKEAAYDAETGTYDLQKYKDTFNAHSDSQSKDWAAGAGQIMTSEGMIASSFGMGADGKLSLSSNAGVEFLGNGVKVQAAAGANISMDRKNIEQHNTDLLYGVDQQMQKDAAALATDSKGNFDDKAYSEILGMMRYDAANQIMSSGAEAKEFQFGASALVSESVKPTFDAMKDVVTLKDASWFNASPETKAAMLEGLKARAGTAPDGSSGLDSLIKKYRAEGNTEPPTSSTSTPNPFK